jgi:hypothetical protein
MLWSLHPHHAAATSLLLLLMSAAAVLHLQEVANRRWPVLMWVFAFDVFCFMFRFIAKLTNVAAEQGEASGGSSSSSTLQFCPQMHSRVCRHWALFAVAVAVAMCTPAAAHSAYFLAGGARCTKGRQTWCLLQHSSCSSICSEH